MMTQGGNWLRTNRSPHYSMKDRLQQRVGTHMQTPETSQVPQPANCTAHPATVGRDAVFRRRSRAVSGPRQVPLHPGGCELGFQGRPRPSSLQVRLQRRDG